MLEELVPQRSSQFQVIVLEERLELSSLAAAGFESTVYTIPPLQRFPHPTPRQSSSQSIEECYNDPMNEATFGEPTRYDSVYWVEVSRIVPNPYQPRREFDETALKSLAESIDSTVFFSRLR